MLFNHLSLFQIPGDLLPSDDQDDAQDGMSRHLPHLGVPAVRLRAVDRRVSSEDVRCLRLRLRRLHGRLVGEQRLPQDLHDRRRLPDVLPHAASLHRHILPAHRRACLETQRAGHARHARAGQHPPRQDQDHAHARRRVRHVRRVVASALLDRTSHAAGATA